MYRTLRMILLLALLLPSLAGAQTLPSGTWRGTIEVPGSPLEVTIRLDNAGGDWSGAIDIPAQGATNLPLRDIEVSVPVVRFTIDGPPGEPTFEGRVAADGASMAGQFRQSGLTFPFTLRRPGAGGDSSRVKRERAAVEDIRAKIPGFMEDWNVPGLSIAIVRDGRVVLSEGFGYRNLADSLPVDDRTLFAIGSATKAFTTTVLGTLVDQGLIDWDKPVTTYLPEFRLKDDYATQHITVLDLVTHMSGLPRHDLMWYGSTFSRQELVERLRYLEPSAELRQRAQYQNLMFMTAGYLAGRVTGSSWEDLVRRRILDPLDMDRTNFTISTMRDDDDAALPYRWDEADHRLEKMPYRSLDAVGPAGSINSTAAEMARWLELQLSNGTVDGERIISATTLHKLHTPQVVFGGETPAAKEVLFNLYAIGWMVHSYRGEELVEHGGNIDGFTSLVGFLPDRNLGVVILTNRNVSALPTVLLYTVIDRMLGLDPIPWNERYIAQRDLARAAMLNVHADSAADVERVPNTTPSHQIAEYVGEYENPGYGRIEVESDHGNLRMQFHGLKVPMEHYHYDVFRIVDQDGPLDGLKIQFGSNMAGDVDRVSIPLESAVPDILFRRMPPQRMSDPEILRQYVGRYSVAGQQLTVSLDGSALKLSVPGQPTSHLAPYRMDRFMIEDLSGYSVRFERQDDRIMRMVLIQPNGTFVARRESSE